MARIKKQKTSLKHRIWSSRLLYLMLLPSILITIVFRYIPLWGVFTAFYDYNPGLGFSGSPFVGMRHFLRFFNDSKFFNILRNTMGISFLNLVLGTVIPIVFAISLNEIYSRKYKKAVQTISYLPHFVSFVVVANIALTVLSPGGPINDILLSLGIINKPVVFFTIPKAFWPLIAGIHIWKEFGWSAIIYIAAITGIDSALYEAAMVDGAGRLRRIWHITLTGIRPTIVVLLILAIPDILSAGFDASYLLGNAMVSDYSEVLDTYIFKMGIQQGQYSYAAAIGLWRQVIALILILSANKFSKRVSDYSLF